MEVRPRAALNGALWCTVALVLTGFTAHVIAEGQRLDARVLDAFTTLRGEYAIDGLLESLAHLGDPLPYMFVASAIALVALARERPRLAVIVVATMILAPLTAETLKLLTAHAREHSVHFADHINKASWPSGHTTGAVTAALCAVMVSPRNLRPVVAVVGGVYALAIGYTVIALVWHFPSDVIGAYLLSMAYVLVAVAAAQRWPDPRPAVARRQGVATGVGAAVIVVLGIGTLALSYVRPGELLDHAGSNTTVFAAGAGIAALAAVLAFLLVRTMRDD